VTEREGDWFKRALVEADKIVPLASVVPSGTVDPVQHLFDRLYVSMRSAMSHAKSGRRVLLPQDKTERRAVTDSLRVLVGLFLRLADSHLGARRLGGGMFAGGFRMTFGPSLDQMTVYVSDDESPFSATDSVPNPGGGVMGELTPAAPMDSPRPFVLTKLWKTSSANLVALPFIRRAVGLHKWCSRDGGRAGESARIGSASTLEVMLGVRGSNTRQPRERYSF
jgi:hypothetical protein